MKKLIIVLFIGFISCNNKEVRIQQEISETKYLTPSGVSLCTYVWYKDEIIQSYYDDISIVTDSLVCVRKHQADSMVNRISKVNINIEKCKE